MKESISKSLVLSFFLIGIILGLLLIDSGTISLPVPGWLQSGTEGESAGQQTVIPAPPRPAESVTRRRGEERATGASVSTSSQPVGEPVVCDREAARAVREKAREIAVIAEQGKVLNVTLGEAWAFYSAGIQRSFVERFAASDTCLHGSAREIRFFFRGELVATAGIHGAIELEPPAPR